MFKIKIVRECDLCGRENTHKSNICPHCRKKLVLIEEPVCSICGIPLISEKNTCLRCRSKQFSFDRNISLFEYRSVGKELLYLYKFEKCYNISYWFAEIINKKLDMITGNFVIVPSPPGIGKKKRKGWDQVELISSILRDIYKRPVYQILVKKRGSAQKKLNLEERKKNMAGRISIKPNSYKKIPGRIILLDDIFTTGATANECARALKDGGTNEVISLTLAID